MKWWGWLWWLILLSALAGCACPQPQQAYQQRVPPSVYHAPPSMYSTVLRRNKQGKMVRVRVQRPVAAEPSAGADPPQAAGASVPPPVNDAEIWTSRDPQIESDLNDLAVRVNEMRRRMSHEPTGSDVRQ